MVYSYFEPFFRELQYDIKNKQRQPGAPENQDGSRKS